MTYFQLDQPDGDGEWELTCPLGDMPVDPIIEEAGHESNGAFWEGLSKFLVPEAAEKVEFDSEGDLYAAYGARADLHEIQVALDAFVADPRAASVTLERARQMGIDLDPLE